MEPHYHVTVANPQTESAVPLGEELDEAAAASRYQETVAAAAGELGDTHRQDVSGAPPEAITEFAGDAGIVRRVRITPCLTDHTLPPVQAAALLDECEPDEITALQARVAALEARIAALTEPPE